MATTQFRLVNTAYVSTDAGRTSRETRMSKHLLEARLKKGLSQRALARLVGTSQSQINKLELGERKLTKEWAERIAPFVGCTAKEILFGIADAETTHATIDGAVRPTIKSVPVIGTVAAGQWMEQDATADVAVDDIPYIPGRYAAIEQRAYRVVGPSMNKLKIADGEYVICVPYWQARAVLTDGDIVVIERRRGQLTERTVKQLAITADSIELWPRSTDPRFQVPIVVPRRIDMEEPDGTTVEVTDLVIGRYAEV